MPLTYYWWGGTGDKQISDNYNMSVAERNKAEERDKKSGRGLQQGGLEKDSMRRWFGPRLGREANIRLSE